jgi:hypothetical protein
MQKFQTFQNLKNKKANISVAYFIDDLIQLKMAIGWKLLVCDGLIYICTIISMSSTPKSLKGGRGGI